MRLSRDRLENLFILGLLVAFLVGHYSVMP